MIKQSELKNYLFYNDIENLPCDLQEVFETDLHDYLLVNNCVLNNNNKELLNIIIDKFDGVFRFTFCIDYKLNRFFYYDNKRI
jgi:hypothetical protein